MKQIIQSIKNGETTLEEIPPPSLSSGSILIKTHNSLVSQGTEKMLVDFGKASLIEKARQQPDKVSLVLNKIKTEGLLPTLQNVFSKLDQPIPLGYCNVGEVIGIGSNVQEFNIGDRVTSNGNHAEIVSVPKNLVAKIPDSVSNVDACFTVIGAIGLQGIRLLNPQFGEVVVVVGLGLIGILTCQILKMSGCRVIGIDLNSLKCELAAKYDVEVIDSSKSNAISIVSQLTDGNGADGIIITASAKSDKIISEAAQMSKKRGKIILIGVVGLNINRADFYEKELSFQVSCSYGPGRYDNQYEQKGIDYPFPFVRWTEKRNFESILYSLSKKNINVSDLVTKTVDLDDYYEVYNNFNSEFSIASILRYPPANIKQVKNTSVKINHEKFNKTRCTIGIIGAGNFTSSVVMPLLSKNKANIKMISSQNGLNSTQLAKKYRINFSTSDYNKILQDNDIDTVIITTRHDSHSKLVEKSLLSGKNTYVEKPLSLNQGELNQIKKIIPKIQKKRKPHPILTVGFNRRFSPHVLNLKNNFLSNNSLMNIVINMNAGYLPKDHWAQDICVGGGRIIGEACHLIDTCVFLTGSLVSSVCSSSLGLSSDIRSDNVSILLKFMNGSNAVINYFSNGPKRYPKEKIEIFCQQKVFVINNFRTTEIYGEKEFKRFKTKLDKGHEKQFSELIKRIKEGGEPLISLNELFNVTETSFRVLESLKTKKWTDI